MADNTFALTDDNGSPVSKGALNDSVRAFFGVEDPSPSEVDGPGDAPEQGVQEPDSPTGTEPQPEPQHIPLERLGEVNAKRREAEDEVGRLKAELAQAKAELRQRKESPHFDGVETEDGFSVSRDTYAEMQQLKLRDYVMDTYSATKDQADAISKTWSDFKGQIDVDRAYRLAVADNPNLFSATPSAEPAPVPSNPQRATRPGGGAGRSMADDAKPDPSREAAQAFAEARNTGDGHAQLVPAANFLATTSKFQEFLSNG